MENMMRIENDGATILCPQSNKIRFNTNKVCSFLQLFSRWKALEGSTRARNDKSDSRLEDSLQVTLQQEANMCLTM